VPGRHLAAEGDRPRATSACVAAEGRVATRCVLAVRRVEGSSRRCRLMAEEKCGDGSGLHHGPMSI
jgi:hypothetical protein